MEKFDERTRLLKQAALALSDTGDHFPAIKRNASRVLASIRMMEINVLDVVRLSVPEHREQD